MGHVYEKVFLFTVLLLVGLGLSGVQAQEAVTASGGNGAGSAGTISFTVGQVSYVTGSGAGGSVEQGVQQPYHISVVSGIEEATGIGLRALAYPNPATDLLTLEVTPSAEADLGPGFRGVSYLLYDMNGSLLQADRITASETRIVMSHLASSVYYLRVLKNDREIKTFKIIKN